MRMLKGAFIMILLAGCGQHKSHNYGFVDNSNSFQGKKAETNGEKLIEAINLGDEAAFNLSLASGININDLLPNGKTPLIQSVIQSRVRFAWLLIQKGASLTVKDVEGLTAIDRAKENEAMWNLLDSEKQKNSREALLLAIDNEESEVIFKLLSHQVNPNFISDTSGETPLTHAILLGSLISVKTLAAWKDKEGINTINNNFANAKGELPLSLAIKSGSKKMIDVLKKNGAKEEKP